MNILTLSIWDKGVCNDKRVDTVLLPSTQHFLKDIAIISVPAKGSPETVPEGSLPVSTTCTDLLDKVFL